MKERILKDGKKDRRGWGPVRRLDEGEDVILSRIQRSTKEAGYMIRRGEEGWVGLFDPERSLHIGRHDGKAGVVYRFKHTAWNGDRERGVLQWDGERGAEGLKKAAASFALKRAGQRVTKTALETLIKPEAWGRTEFWEDMVRRCKLAEDLLIVQEVMKS